MIDLNFVSLAAISGAVAGSVFGGLGGRLAMRLVAIVVGATPSFTLEGTLALMVGGAILGIPIGLGAAGLYAVTRRRMPVLWLGLALSALAGSVFFMPVGGEFGLLQPWQGALLFGPLPLAITGGAFGLYTRLHRRVTVERRVPAWWMAGYTIAAVWAFSGLGTLASETLRLPYVAWRMVEWLGLSVGADFAAGVAIHQTLGLLFLAGYLALTWLVFWLAPGRTVQAGAIGCLLLAAGLFHGRGPLGGALRAGEAAAALLPAVAAVLGVAMLAVVYWRLLAHPHSNVSRRRICASLGLAAGGVLVVWLLVLFVPGYGMTNLPAWTTVFSVTIYLLPWLALPAGLLWAVMPARPAWGEHEGWLSQAAASPAADAG